MKTKIKKVLTVLIYTASGLVVLFYVIGFLTFLNIFGGNSNSTDNASKESQESMIETTLEWARLAKFPDNSKEFHIETNGNLFTRTFKGSFKLEPEELKNWKLNSTGIQEATPEELSPTTFKYVIKPGGGANYAEVIINESTGKVNFRVSWS